MTRAPASWPPVVRALLAGAIDYAGLFPPAGLDMRSAVENYLAYRDGPDSWALGRLVVPVSRFDEFEAAVRRAGRAPDVMISVSALLGNDPVSDLSRIELLNHESIARGAWVASVEAKVASEAAVSRVLDALPKRMECYCEVALDEGLGPMLSAIAARGASAKVRTGATTADGIPSVGHLVGFLEGVASRKLPFKATAGLHHPIRGEYPLTYAVRAPRAVMHGYLNVLLAAALLYSGIDARWAEEALLEQDPDSIRINGDAIVWRDQRIDGHALADMRDTFCHSFGSCSFTEPLDELPAWSRE